MTDSASSASAATPFHDLDAYVDLPRGAGLTLSPDGSRLVTAVQTLEPEAHEVGHGAVGGRPRPASDRRVG